MVAAIIVILAGFLLYVLLKPPINLQNVLLPTDKTNPSFNIRSHKISKISRLRKAKKFSYIIRR